MSTAADISLLPGILAGVVLCWFCYRSYHLSEQLGRTPFVVLTAVLGTGCVVVGVTGLLPSVLIGADESGWHSMTLLFWLFTTVPWFGFAITYTGTRPDLSWRTLAVVGLPHLLVVADTLFSIFGIEHPPLVDIFSSLVFLYIIFLATSATYVILQGTNSCGHTTVWQGVALAAVVFSPFVVWNFIGLQAIGAVGRAGLFSVGATAAAVGVGAAWDRYRLFGSAPAIATLGEQALTGETDDLMFVVDNEDRLITLNETALETLSITRSSAHGEPVHDVLGHDSDQLDRADTVGILTAEGTRRYDPQVSRVGDSHGNDIGATLSLRDITERDRRKQRLAVLNRVLRHNLRNQIDVIKGNAEVLAQEDAEVTQIIDAADEIASLGQHARRIDQYISEASEDSAVDLEETVRSVLETLGAEETAVTVSVESAPAATVTTNRQALVGALESALDNAVTYAESAVTVEIEPDPDGYSISVSDDGPGIPDWELESLETGTESPLQHSTGLGLWQLKWAVRTLNGDLSFETTDGTTVEILVPRREDIRRDR